MDNREVLVDTSVLIDFLRKTNKQKTLLWQIKENGYRCFISTITIFELYAGAISKKHYDDLSILLKWFEIEAFSEKTAKISAKIYNNLKSQNRLIEFRDIFIGATAIILDIPVITLNTKHFRRMKKIRILNKEDI